MTGPDPSRSPAALAASARRPPPSIRRQITLPGLLLTGAVLFSFVLVMVLHDISNRRADLERKLLTLARIVSVNTEAAAMFASDREAKELLGALKAWPDLAQAELFLADGRSLAHHVGEGDGRPCSTLRPDGLGLHFGWCSLVVYQPVVHLGQPIGLLALEMSLRSSYLALAQSAAFSAIAALIAFGLSVPLWRRLAERVARPLGELVQLTEHVGQHQDFSGRSQASGSAEVLALSTAFNRTMVQLALRDTRLNHELGQRRQAEIRLNDLAYFDSVTGLHNRHHFMESIDRALTRAVPGRGGALVYIDLDGFKQINDTLGHDQGDELLRQVGARLQQGLRAGDVICRLGGDEFAVILEQAGTQAELEGLAAMLVELLARPYTLGADVGRVSASMGLCRFPEQAAERESLLRQADSAMYEAKQQGKNRFCLYTARGDTAPSRAQLLEQALLAALDANELRVVYQPKVVLADGHCFGMEALLRWRHPSLGPIGPDEFVPLAEANRQILPIGHWVLQQACTQLLAWRRQLPALRMSVNLSPVQLGDDAALDALCRVLADCGLPAGAVELELTESQWVDRSPAMLQRMDRLRTAGFGLAIDDFGTGYSSLAYIDSFPITTLKIDRAFVRPLAEAHRSTAIVRAVVAIGDTLGLDVVAEGIETAQQADVLKQLGCTLGQGFLYARPLEAGEAGHYLAAEQARVSAPLQPSLVLQCERPRSHGLRAA